ncbi:hypothetical protein [Hoylesella loescheii]|uniref:hypothetical protein n=1 Tax=Hoylesella loescheii TaxID=840 RepID=UPI0036F3E98B
MPNSTCAYIGCYKGSNLTVSKRELKRLTTRANRGRYERWRLEVGRVSWCGDRLWNKPPR